MWTAGLGCLAAAGVGCGGSDAPDVGTSDEIPAEMVVEAVAAGPDVGWVVGRDGQAGGGEHEVWRLVPGEPPRRVAEVPTVSSLDVEASDGGLVVAGLACGGDGPDESCAETTAVVHVVADDGSVGAPIELGRRPGPIEDGDGLEMLGGQGDVFWVSSSFGLSQVDPSGDVEELPGAEGQVCGVDGDLFAVSYVDDPSAGTDPPVVSPDQLAGRRLQVSALVEGHWTPLDASAEAVESARPVTAACGPQGIEVTEIESGQLLATWTGDNWAVARAATEPPPSITFSPAASRFRQVADGTVHARDAAGDFTATSLVLPDLTVDGVPQPSLVADSSATVVVACVVGARTGTPDADDGVADQVAAVSHCDAARR